MRDINYDFIGGVIWGIIFTLFVVHLIRLNKKALLNEDKDTKEENP